MVRRSLPTQKSARHMALAKSPALIADLRYQGLCAELEAQAIQNELNDVSAKLAHSQNQAQLFKATAGTLGQSAREARLSQLRSYYSYSHLLKAMQTRATQSAGQNEAALKTASVILGEKRQRAEQCVATATRWQRQTLLLERFERDTVENDQVLELEIARRAKSLVSDIEVKNDNHL